MPDSRWGWRIAAMCWPMAKIATRVPVGISWKTRTWGASTWEGDAMRDAAPPVADGNAVMDDAAAGTVDARDTGGARSSRFVAGVLVQVLAGMWVAGWMSGTSAQAMLSLTAWGVMLGGI